MEIWKRMERMEFRTRMERIVRNVCHERYERYERHERYERYERHETLRNVKQEMAIGGDATRHSCAAPKIQQFWAIFRRLGINIFNLREHLSPRNFAYSALSFT